MKKKEKINQGDKKKCGFQFVGSWSFSWTKTHCFTLKIEYTESQQPAQCTQQREIKSNYNTVETNQQTTKI